MNPSFDQLREKYAHAWHDMVIDPDRLKVMQAAAAHIIVGRTHYSVIEKRTGVPWYVIGLLHLRESDCNFHTHLANGDSLNARTHDVPRGRIPPPAEPPFSFDDAAVDALQLDKLDRADWSSIERIAYQMELWNGWGYHLHGVPSAYLWAGTNQYHGGKYVADNVWDAHAIDRQVGVMGVLKCIEDTCPGTLPEAEHPEEALTSSPKAKPEPMDHSAANEVLATQSVKYRIKSWFARLLGLGGGSTIGLLKADQAGLADPWSISTTIANYVKDHGIGIAAVVLLAAIATVLILQWLQRDDLIRGDYRPSGEGK